MSYINVMMNHSAKRVVEYLFVGNGEKRAKHLAAGTDRAAFVSCSLDSPEDFIAACEAHGRACESMSIVQSFPAKELKVSNPNDVERCNQLGVALARRLAPNNDYLVVTHVDGASGILHNHIVVVNHDLETGYALTKDQRKLWTVRSTNNAIMEEEGLSVIGKRQPEWRHKRAELKQGTFVYELGNAVEAARTDSRVHDEDSFRMALADYGVELVEREYPQGDGSIELGWIYKMRFDDGKKNRIRSRKASSLSYSFTREAMLTQFEVQQMRALEDERKAAQQAEWNREVYNDLEGYSDDEVVSDLAALAAEQHQALLKGGASESHDDVYRELADTLSDGAKVAATHTKLVAEFAAAKTQELLARQAFHATDNRTPYERDYRIAALSRVARNKNTSIVIRLLALMLKQKLAESNHQKWLEQEQVRKERRYVARGEMWSAEKRARAAKKALDEFRGEVKQSSFMNNLGDLIKDDTQLEYTLGKSRQRQRQKSL